MIFAARSRMTGSIIGRLVGRDDRADRLALGVVLGRSIGDEGWPRRSSGAASRMVMPPRPISEEKT